MPGAILLVFFFFSSSILSRLQVQRKASLAEKFSKDSRRDLGQVFANGGVAALAAGIYSLVQTEWAWTAFVASLATATADTWSTEIGVVSTQKPRLINTGNHVEPGTSGGVTLRGTLAAAAGATSISGLAALLQTGNTAAHMYLICALSGLTGSLFDSIPGATIQGKYFCKHCSKETERHPRHTCGRHTRLLRGWRWINNDWVNFLGTTLGALIAAVYFSQLI